jgi:sec-independent protein translocase protein TatA
LNEGAVVLSEIIGPDLLIIFLIFALLFGSSQLPKLARSIGQASKEFRQGFLDSPAPNDGSEHPGE